MSLLKGISVVGQSIKNKTTAIVQAGIGSHTEVCASTGANASELSVRDLFENIGSEYTANAKPEYSTGDIYNKVIRFGNNGWTEAFYQYGNGEYIKNYQKRMVLRDGNEYALQSYGKCSNRNCDYSIVLYLHDRSAHKNRLIAEASEAGSYLLHDYGTSEALSLLDEALQITIGYDQEIPYNERKNPCVVLAVDKAKNILNGYIRDGNYAIDNYTEDTRDAYFRIAYRDTFESLMKVQDDVVYEMPECAHEEDVLAVQRFATEKLNELKVNFKGRSDNFFDYFSENDVLITLAGITGCAVAVGPGPTIFGSWVASKLSFFGTAASGGVAVALYSLMILNKLALEANDTKEYSSNQLINY